MSLGERVLPAAVCLCFAIVLATQPSTVAGAALGGTVIEGDPYATCSLNIPGWFRAQDLYRAAVKDFASGRHRAAEPAQRESPKLT